MRKRTDSLVNPMNTANLKITPENENEQDIKHDSGNGGIYNPYEQAKFHLPLQHL